MVGHKFLELYGERAAAGASLPFDVTVIGEEPRLAYDRVGLSKYFDGKSPEELSLARPGQYEAAGFAVRLATRARRIDRERRVVEVEGGQGEVPYDVWCSPPARRRSCRRFPGATARAASSTARSRTSKRIAPMRQARRQRGVVIGGGLLGLEAAKALSDLGLETHVVEFAPRLMARAGRRRRRRACCARSIEALGVARAHRQEHHARSSTAKRRVHAHACSPTAARSRPTWSCSRPASARATSWRAPAAWRSAQRGGIVDRRATAAPRDPDDLRHRRVRAVRRPHLRPGRARLPDGARRRRRHLRRRGRRVHRRRHEHQAQAAGRRRGELRRRASARTPAPRVLSIFDDRKRGLQEAGRVAPTASSCWAACWSATPPTTATLAADDARTSIALPERPRC